MSTLLTRRHVLTVAGQVAGGAALSAALGPAASAPSFVFAAAGALLPPDQNGIRLPAGFTSRVVARGLHPVISDSSRPLDYEWHELPDGGAVFGQPDGGWIYVSNSESHTPLSGGAGALRFDSSGRLTAAYRILSHTWLNCGGGPTPWGTWLSCEEVAFGFVYECDPTGVAPAKKRPALGAFKHEAVAVDPTHRHLYLTEDEYDGRLYRFIPANYPDLSGGRLEVASVDAATNQVTWHTVPLPTPSTKPSERRPTRAQILGSTPFKGGEGIWFHNDTVYFTTKGDNRVWALDTNTQTLRVLYDAATHPTPILRGVDNVTVSSSGKVLVAEDGGDMQLVVLDSAGNVAPLLQVIGQDSSEITGPAFNPGGDRLYFSSQRGPLSNGDSHGITYEVRGPFAELMR